MQLGSLLIAKGLITKDDVERAVAHHQQNGGRIGDSLVALGFVTANQLVEIMNEVPPSPRTLADTDIDPTFLLQLILKGMRAENWETPSQISSATKLSNSVVKALIERAMERKLIESAGQAQNETNVISELRYVLSGDGRDWAMASLEQGQYFGPAPVSLKAYTAQLGRQKISSETVTRSMMDEGFNDLVISERFLDRLGHAINSGSAILIYGPAGNGKTTIAERINDLFEDFVYIPYCFEVDGQIIKVFDPSVHVPIEDISESVGSSRGLRREQRDYRWIPCRRPMVRLPAVS